MLKSIGVFLIIFAGAQPAFGWLLDFQRHTLPKETIDTLKKSIKSSKSTKFSWISVETRNKLFQQAIKKKGARARLSDPEREVYNGYLHELLDHSPQCKTECELLIAALTTILADDAEIRNSTEAGLVEEPTDNFSAENCVPEESSFAKIKNLFSKLRSIFSGWRVAPTKPEVSIAAVLEPPHVQEEASLNRRGSGLDNPGNLCYSNAALQYIFHSETIKNALNQSELPPEPAEGPQREIWLARRDLKEALKGLLEQMKQSHQSNGNSKQNQASLDRFRKAFDRYVSTSGINDFVGEEIELFSLDPAKQRDSMEFLQHLLGAVIPDYRPIQTRSSAFSRKESSFNGVQFRQGERLSGADQPAEALFHLVSLGKAADGAPVVDLLKDSLASETIDFEVVAYDEELNEKKLKVPARRDHQLLLPADGQPLEEFPIFIQRTTFSGGRAGKSKLKVNPFKVLKVEFHDRKNDTKEYSYQATSFLIQRGGAGSGHYFTYTYDPDKKEWWEHNDSRVTRVQLSKQQRAEIMQNCVLVNYRRVR